MEYGAGYRVGSRDEVVGFDVSHRYWGASPPTAARNEVGVSSRRTAILIGAIVVGVIAVLLIVRYVNDIENRVNADSASATRSGWPSHGRCAAGRTSTFNRVQELAEYGRRHQA